MTVCQLTELTWAELRAAADTSIALLPVGSQEQHGGHLPLGTDRLLADAVVEQALSKLDPAGPHIVRLPTLPYGFSPHHAFAAAITVSAQTLIDILGEIVDSVVRCGFRRMMIVNGHGGNDESVRLAVKQAALRHDIAIAAANYWSVGDPGRSPGHAGAFETSLMLAVDPALVRPPSWDNAPEPPPLFENPPYPGVLAERHGEWERVGGVTDDARGATAEAGEQLLAARAAELAAAITAFDRATAESHGTASPRADNAENAEKGH